MRLKSKSPTDKIDWASVTNNILNLNLLKSIQVNLVSLYKFQCIRVRWLNDLVAFLCNIIEYIIIIQLTSYRIKNISSAIIIQFQSNTLISDVNLFDFSP